MVKLPKEWSEILGADMQRESFQKLGQFLTTEYATRRIWPAQENIFKAYELCKPEDVKVVIIGQDPYPNAHAHGLSFSTTQKNRPVSLRYIFKEISENYPEYELSTAFPTNVLTNWAKQGVFLLNSVLTVREGEPNSHAKKGWEEFTAATISAIAGDTEKSKVFMLWGRHAQDLFGKATSLHSVRAYHLVLTAGHPAAAAYGKNLFSGNQHFIEANNFLLSTGRDAITWKTSQ